MGAGQWQEKPYSLHWQSPTNLLEKEKLPWRDRRRRGVEQNPRKYILDHPTRVARLARLLAKGIDLFLVLILAIFLYPLGLILAITYLGLSDGLRGGQSVGKRLIGMGVISLEDGKPCRFKQSLIRNLPFLVPLICAIIPLWGLIIGILLGVPLVAIEIYLLFKLDSGHRLGDVMADTSVIACDGHRIEDGKKGPTRWFGAKEGTGHCCRS